MFPNTMRGHQWRILYETLDENNWNRTDTSKALCISLTTVKVMIREMRSLGIEVPKSPHGKIPVRGVLDDDHP